MAILEYGIILGWKKYGKEKIVDPKAGKWFDVKFLDNTFKRVDLISFLISSLMLLVFILGCNRGKTKNLAIQYSLKMFQFDEN